MKKTRLNEIKARFAGMPAEKKGEVVAGIRAKHLDRWMERMAEIGRPVTDPEQIDYSDQQIHIEWLLCDPYWLHCIKSGDQNKKNKFLAQLNEEEVKCYYTPTSDGVCYADMEKGSMNREMAKALLKIKAQHKDV